MFFGCLILLGASWFGITVGFSQLGGYDLSPLIDLTWRFHQGQIPGLDYINTFPPILLVLCQLISNEAPYWGSLIWLNVYASVFTFLFLLTVSGNDRKSTLWVCGAAIIISMPLVYTNHIWHSSLSQLSAIMFFFSVFRAFRTTGFGVVSFLALLISSSLLVLTKQNVALPVYGATLLFLTIFGGTKRFRVLGTIFIGGLLGIYFCIEYVKYPVSYFMDSYLAVFGRAKPSFEMLKQLLKVPTHYPLLVLTFLLYRNAKREGFFKRLNRKTQLLAMMFGVLSLLPIYSNWDTKVNDLPLPLFVLITLVFLGSTFSSGEQSDFSTTPEKRHIFVLVISTFSVCLFGGLMRERMARVGPFFESKNDVTILTGYFTGLKTGNGLARALEEMTRARYQFSGKHFFFGPRIEFGYVHTNSPSPLLMPLWWHPGTSYRLHDSELVFNRFKERQFDILVFAKGDRTRMPEEILNYIQNEFHVVPGYSHLDVYRSNLLLVQK